jgi:hypothetical protein
VQRSHFGLLLITLLCRTSRRTLCRMLSQMRTAHSRLSHVVWRRPPKEQSANLPAPPQLVVKVQNWPRLNTASPLTMAPARGGALLDLPAQRICRQPCPYVRRLTALYSLRLDQRGRIHQTQQSPERYRDDVPSDLADRGVEGKLHEGQRAGKRHAPLRSKTRSKKYPWPSGVQTRVIAFWEI